MGRTYQTSVSWWNDDDDPNVDPPKSEWDRPGPEPEDFIDPETEDDWRDTPCCAMCTALTRRIG